MTDRPVDLDEMSVRCDSWERISQFDYERIIAIWEKAFPPSERSPRDTVSLRNSTWLWTARSMDDEVIGFATALLLGTARAAYLEYLAVDTTRRGRGTGAAMLASILWDLRSEGAVRGIVLEVEDPARTPGNDPLLGRRVAFYERWGAKPVRIISGYSMPDLSNPGDRVPMLILWRGIADDDEPGRPELTRILTDLYNGYYAHAAPEGHLEEMVGRIT